MLSKREKEDLFLLSLLRTLSQNERALTLEEVRDRYLQIFPPSFFERKIGYSVPLEKIQRGLNILLERMLINREVTRFTDRPLKQDVVLYSISSVGVRSIQVMKHKK